MTGRCLCGQPNKNPRHWVTNERPWQIAFHRCCHSCWGIELELSLTYVISLGKGPWKLGAGLLWTLLHVPFSFADVVLCPFAVINSHECNQMLVPWVFLVNYWTGSGLGNPDTVSDATVCSVSDEWNKKNLSMQLTDLWHYILTCSLCSLVKCVIPQVSEQWFSIYIYKWRQQEGCRVLYGFMFRAKSTTGPLIFPMFIFRLKRFLL